MEHAMASPYLFLQNLAMVLGVAGLTTLVFQKLHLPVVVGYLIAGIIVGPHLPIPLIADKEIIRTLAELGVILLMFSIGLEFSIRRLIKLAPSTGFIALLECSLMIWIGYITGQFFGWGEKESIYLGTIVAISSTTIIAKAFSEEGVKGKLSELVYGILIAEDLIAILLLTIFSTMGRKGHFHVEELLKASLTLAHFLVFALIIGILVIPRLMKSIVRLNRPETTLITAIGLCFSMALLAQKLGYSVALGAFLAGALIAESGVEKIVEKLVEPVRDMFGAIFFVAVGMLFDPSIVIKHWLAIAILVCVVIGGKFIGVTLGSFLTGFGLRPSVRAGLSLGQIGEFSFILAGVGLATGSTRNFLYGVTIAVSGITTLLTPWLIRLSGPLARFIDDHLPRSLHTFVSVYETWIGQMRSRKVTSTTNARIRHLVLLLGIDFSFLAGFTIGISASLNKLTNILVSMTGLEAQMMKMAIITAGIILSSPFILGIIRCVGGLGILLATKALPASKDGIIDLAHAPRKTLVITLQLLILALVGIPFLALTQPFIPLVFSLSLLLGSLILIGFVFWKRLEDLQGHIKAGAQLVIEALSPQQIQFHDQEQPSMEKMLPGLGAITPITLSETSAVIGKTLGQINLRGLTGATVIAISSKEGNNVFPSGNTVLYAGNILTLTGSQEAIDLARRILEVKKHPLPM